MLRLLGRRYLLATAVATALAGLAIGIPSDLVPNPWFVRMTPVRPVDLVLWPLMSIAIGALLATYALPSSSRAAGGVSAGAGGGGLLGIFAVGCPVCNKLVVLALGYSGALAYFEPIQPLLGVSSVALSAVILRARLLSLSRGCPTGLLPRAAAQ